MKPLRRCIGSMQQEAKLPAWSRAGCWTRVGTNVALPWGFTIGAGGEFRWTNFEGQWFPFTTDNSARENRNRIGPATRLNRAVTVFGFSPQVVFSNERRKSNAQLFECKFRAGMALSSPRPLWAREGMSLALTRDRAATPAERPPGRRRCVWKIHLRYGPDTFYIL